MRPIQKMKSVLCIGYIPKVRIQIIRIQSISRRSVNVKSNVRITMQARSSYNKEGKEAKPVQRAFGLEIPETLEEACPPHRTALVVYDMQVGILRQLRNGAEITAKVLKVL